MEVLKSLGITDRDIRKISVEVADSIVELESISAYANEETAPPNIKEYYKSLVQQVERYILSNQFRKDAKSAGVKVTSIASEEEEVVVAEMPKVSSKSVAERMAERKKSKGKTIAEREAERKKDKPVVEIEEPTVEVEEPIVEIEEPIVEIEEPISETDVITIGELFGVAVKGTSSGEIVGRDMFSMMLSYGRTDYILGFHEDSKGFHYRLDLPQSLGQAVFSFSNTGGDNSHTSLVEVWKAYTRDNNATLNLVSRSEEQLEELSDVLGFGGVTKDRRPLTATELKEERYNAELFSVVSDVYSRGISGLPYYEIGKEIKAEWVAKESSNSNLTYGLHYMDYVYTAAETLYKKGGYTIVAKKHTFFVPKGLTKKETFAEIGFHLKELSTKPKFEKSIEIGKRFQVSTGNLDEAKDCRVIASRYLGDKGEVVVADGLGGAYKISSSAYSYFKKYYGEVLLKISESTIAVYYNSSLVGLIASENLNSIEIAGMFEQDDFKAELRSIDTDAFDFMVSKKESVEEATEVEIEEIEKGETDESEEALKDELTDRIEFLQELYDDAVEEGDNQQLIDELDMELETLRDLLEDIV